jgi:hypothetical protein
MSNVDPSKLTPGVFGVSHGSGVAGELIRHATASWAGHAFLYLGNGMLVQGQPPVAALATAGSHDDAIWAWRMWDALKAEHGWDDATIKAMQDKVVGRGHALVGVSYDTEAYAAFALEVLKLRSEEQMEDWFRRDTYRVCSALVADALMFGGVPLEFVPSDGPGLTTDPDKKAAMPPNLVAPGMLLGLAQRKEWT